MKIALVGCGFVCDNYLETLRYHPELELVGVHDRLHERALGVAQSYPVQVYASLSDLLDDPRIELVVNLTNPASHADVTRACLLANKHVYSEKPLTLDLEEARQLVALAKQRSLILASAPCSILGEAAQTLIQQLRQGRLGQVRLAYAELDDGAVYLEPFQKWKNSLGVPWPYEDEFSLGCVMEHAAYALTWLIGLWGSVSSITCFSHCLVPEKGGRQVSASDFSVGVLQFANGVVARLTCSIIAPKDRSLTIVGDGGTLRVEDFWNYASPVTIKKRPSLVQWMRQRREGQVGPTDLHQLLGAPQSSQPVPWLREPIETGLSNNMDFSRGIAECAQALGEGRDCRLGGDFALHVLECTLALQRTGSTQLTTSCAPL